MTSIQSRSSLADAIPEAIGAPAMRALHSNGIDTYEQLARWGEDELAALHGVGPKALRILGAGLSERGASFAPPDSA